jgi:hypothetical protein
MDAAARFADRHFPQASAVILGGSAADGSWNEASDLDLIILDDTREQPYRETFQEYGWKIEAFVLTSSTYRLFYAESVREALPSVLRMCAHGKIVKDQDGMAETLAREAAEDLEAGPWPWSAEERDGARYEITEFLDDFASSGTRLEDWLLAGKLADLLHRFVLRANGRWIGEGKWSARSLEAYDRQLASRLEAALEMFYRHHRKEPLIDLADSILRPFGGRLSAGHTQYSRLGEEEGAL